MAFPNLVDIKGVGPIYFNRITQAMMRESLSLEQIYQLSAEEIKQKFDLPINVARAIASASKSENQQFNQQKSAKIKQTIPSVTEPITSEHFLVINREDKNYPAKLHHILGEKAPELLYVWGNLDLFNKPGIGFCGSRNVTNKGLEVTRDISEQIAKLDWVTVSGHARGVDTMAHLTALENNGGTIIVLPQGIDGFKLRMELRSNAKYENLLIVSEFPPSTNWSIGYAMQRNTTIIGLSDAMVLVESRSEGGTFNAGKTALKLKHPLFVVKFQDSQKSNAGNDYFLQSGANQLMKNPQTNRANIEGLVATVKAGPANQQPKPVATQLMIDFKK